MFGRDKDNKVDNDGLRRMREAIRQRLEQEEGTGGEEAPEEQPYRAPERPAARDGGSGELYAGGGGNSFETLGRESDYSFLNVGRSSERTVIGLEPPAPPAAPAAQEWEPGPSRNETTLVAADTVWQGTLRSSGPIRIEGNFEGRIETAESLYIAASARVEATVDAATIVVAGQLSGQINCRERLEILPTGRVSGQIDAGRFIVQEGAFLGGQVRMRAASEAGGNGDDTRPMLQRIR